MRRTSVRRVSKTAVEKVHKNGRNPQDFNHFIVSFTVFTLFETFLFILRTFSVLPNVTAPCRMLLITLHIRSSLTSHLRVDCCCFFSGMTTKNALFIYLILKKRASQNRKAPIDGIRFLTISLRLYFSSGSYRAHRLRHRSKQRYRGIFSKSRKARGSDECL